MLALLRPVISFGLWAALLTGPLLAQTTLVVDDDPGPGVDYSNVQDALGAASPGDTIDVRPGLYPGFFLNVPVTVIGSESPRPRIAGQVTVFGPALTGRVTLSRLRIDGVVYATDCEETVLLDQLSTGSCVAVRSSDLRLARVVADGLDLLDTRCQVSGATITSPLSEPGAVARGQSFLHMDQTSVRGRGGANCQSASCLFTATSAGDGMSGLVVGPQAAARLVRCEIRGGEGGVNICGCSFDGLPGASLDAQGRVEAWDTLLTVGLFGQPDEGISLGATGSLDESKPFPSLLETNSALAGGPASWTLMAEPGASCRLIFGRAPVLAPTSGTGLDRLVTLDRVASLGAMPASGELPVNFGTAAAWPAGTTLYLQVSRTLPGGETEFSNSLAIVVR
jgi:hypothetical protein